MQKGTHSPSKSRTPVKLLLAITDPGPKPTAPTAPTHPGSAPEPLNHPDADLKSGELSYESYGNKGWDKKSIAYEDEFTDYESRVSAKNVRDAETTSYNKSLATYNTNLSTYNTNLATYNTALANWNTADASRTDKQSKNTKTTSKYQQDLRKFFSNLGKTKNTRKSYNRTRGSRGSNRSKGGTRG